MIRQTVIWECDCCHKTLCQQMFWDAKESYKRWQEKDWALPLTGDDLPKGWGTAEYGDGHLCLQCRNNARDAAEAAYLSATGEHAEEKAQVSVDLTVPGVLEKILPEIEGLIEETIGATLSVSVK